MVGTQEQRLERYYYGSMRGVPFRSGRGPIEIRGDPQACCAATLRLVVGENDSHDAYSPLRSILAFGTACLIIIVSRLIDSFQIAVILPKTTLCCTDNCKAAIPSLSKFPLFLLFDNCRRPNDDNHWNYFLNPQSTKTPPCLPQPEE